MSTAPQRNEISAGEARLFAVSFSGKLDTGELLTGTPTITDANVTSPIEATLSNKVVSTAELTINGLTVPIGEAVQFLVTLSSTAAEDSYTFNISCATDSTPAQTLTGTVIAVRV